MLPKRNVPKLPPVLTTKYCAISPNWADQHSPYLFGLCFVHAGPTEASRQIPTTPQGCFPGNESSWRKLARISAMVYLVYFHHGDIRKKQQAMTFLLSVRSYLELLPPKLFLLQMSISPSWRKFMSDRWSKLNRETQALYAQGNHMRRQNASNFCWQFSHLFLLILQYFLPHWAGHHQTLNNVLHHKWRSCHDSCYGGDSHRALLDYTYHKDTAMRRYALINAAPSNQFDSPSTMVLPTILTTWV